MHTSETVSLPTTEQGIYAEATRIRGLRRAGMSWRQISETTGYTRVEAIRLAHGESQLMAAVATARYDELNYRIPPAQSKALPQCQTPPTSQPMA